MTLKNWLIFLALGTIWGSSFLWIKVGVGEIGPFMLVTLRVVVAFTALALVIARKRTILPDLRRTWWIFAVLGLFNLAVPFVLISTAEQSLSSGLAAILNATVPLFTLVIAPFFISEERMTLPRLGGLLVGFAGVVVLMSDELRAGANWGDLKGQALMLLATFSYGAASVFARLKTRGMPVEVQAGGQALFASLAMLAILPFAENPLVFPRLPITWLAVLWLGVLGTCLATLMYYYLLHEVGPTRATLVTYLFPLVGVVLGAVFLRERLQVWHLLGGAMILSGIVLVNRYKPPAAVAVTPETAQAD
ncbi:MULTISPECIES: DMT family transporter [Anaerolinea]|uniref:Hypothetical membrane protein n=1 Tax=Anaerolinea thermophila (strain DSM 14523 / JCM 11388 / NBRC 100420 / UNI-1) TaxID=926569 RepID=E8N1W8_ANATU|nr:MULTISPECIES: EamA family transporter [Anaerolinea]BAJ64915.1 hypothetical membrane protein [Anaerolinea thermophila UNI-1]